MTFIVFSEFQNKKFKVSNNDYKIICKIYIIFFMILFSIIMILKLIEKI
jgi:hypothetical protein